MANDLNNRERCNEKQTVVLNVKHSFMEAVEALVDGDARRIFKYTEDTDVHKGLHSFSLNEDTLLVAYDYEGNETPILTDDIINGIFYPEVYVNN